VYVLERLGVRAFEEYLAGLGFDSIQETAGTHGTGLALGNAEVSLEEMVRGFSSFPRLGSPVKLTWAENEALPDARARPSGMKGTLSQPEPLMSPYAAWIIADILSDRSSRFVGFGPAPVLATPFVSMFKTGTANQFQHIWALGATRRFTVGVWMGNFSGETVVGSTGSSIPARIASNLLAALEDSSHSVPESILHAGSAGIDKDANPVQENLAGPVPAGIVELEVCSLSGMAAGKFCTGTTKEWMRDEMRQVCTWHTGAGLFYPPDYHAWLNERFRSGNTSQGGNGRIRIPVQGSVYYLDPSLPPNAQALRVETTGFGPDALLYANGTLMGNMNHAGVYALPLSRGVYRVFVEDAGGAYASVDFEIR
jgi:penicillin-binding protein 1C